MRNFIFFFLTAAFWGGSFVAIKYAIMSINPMAAAMWRVLIGLLFLGVVFAITGRSVRLPVKCLWKVWITGIFAIGLPFALLFWGEQSISAGLAGIINGTMPIWTFVIGIFFLRKLEDFTIGKLCGLILGLVGVVLVFSPAISFGDTKSGSLSGTIAVFLMSISYAIAVVINKRLLSGEKKIDLYVNVFHQLLSGLVFLIIVSVSLEGWNSLLPLDISLPSALGCIYMGIFSTGIAWLMFYYLIKRWGAVKASTITYIVPVMAVFLDYLFFREFPMLIEVIGMLIIFSAVTLIQFGKRRDKVS